MKKIFVLLLSLMFVLSMSVVVFADDGGQDDNVNVNAPTVFSGTVMKPKTVMKQGHDMTSHHQHQMLNHSLGMALQGSNLVMLGQMNMDPGLDAMTIDHGRMMLKDARAMWNETMSDDSMMKMHSSGMSPADDPGMKYTHQLAEAQLKVIDMLEKHADMKAHTMGVHHQHLLLNHSLKMALDGADMNMTSSMGMAPGVDKGAMNHGNKMINNAEKLWNDVMSGSEMMKKHTEGMSPGKDKGMAFTHGLAEAHLKVLELLKNMP